MDEIRRILNVERGTTSSSPVGIGDDAHAKNHLHIQGNKGQDSGSSQTTLISLGRCLGKTCKVLLKLCSISTQMKQGNRHPRARRGGGVPAGVNHRAANQILPSAIKAASQHISWAFGSDAYVFYTNSGLRPKKDFDVERKNFRRIAKYLTDASKYIH